MDPDPNRRSARTNSLWQTIADGSAGAFTRVLVSLVVGLFLAAVACVSAYVLSDLFPRPGWSRAGMPPNTVYVRDEMAVTSFLAAAVAYAAALFWVWSRHRRNRVIWTGAGGTLGILLVAVLLGILVDQEFAGDDEFLVTAVVLVSIGGAVLLWMWLYHRHFTGRPLYDETGVVDLRCPNCQYRMVGLKESRCPECGQQYTLDELVGRQDFSALRRGHTPATGEPPELRGDRPS